MSKTGFSGWREAGVGETLPVGTEVCYGPYASVRTLDRQYVVGSSHLGQLTLAGVGAAGGWHRLAGPTTVRTPLLAKAKAPEPGERACEAYYGACDSRSAWAAVERELAPSSADLATIRHALYARPVSCRAALEALSRIERMAAPSARQPIGVAVGVDPGCGDWCVNIHGVRAVKVPPTDSTPVTIGMLRKVTAEADRICEERAEARACKLEDEGKHRLADKVRQFEAGQPRRPLGEAVDRLYPPAKAAQPLPTSAPGTLDNLACAVRMVAPAGIATPCFHEVSPDVPAGTIEVVFRTGGPR